MKHITGGSDTLKYSENKTAVMLGNFDGLHKGHQALVNVLLARARRDGLETVVFSFSPHPKAFFSEQSVQTESFQTIYSSDEKAFLLGKMGIDVFVEHTFDQAFAGQSPEAFVEVVLAGQLRCRAAVVGEGYRFGRAQAGDSALLQALGARHGIDVIITPLVREGGEKVSSSVIREHIRNTRLKEAATLLTRPFFIRGQVAAGRRIGRGIGFPTVNLPVGPGKLLPPDGVYATRTHFDGKAYKSVTNVGRNPTFGRRDSRSVETFIVDFEEEIYGRTIQVDFCAFMRAERRFESAESLKEQIIKDVAVYSAQ